MNQHALHGLDQSATGFLLPTRGGDASTHLLFPGKEYKLLRPGESSIGPEPIRYNLGAQLGTALQNLILSDTLLGCHPEARKSRSRSIPRRSTRLMAEIQFKQYREISYNVTQTEIDNLLRIGWN
ncbi:hypothetical protein MRX96_056719 [Rhipicephalus microplus]